jgi:hypothetical protein
MTANARFHEDRARAMTANARFDEDDFLEP